MIDDVITANDDKEPCEDRTSENITTVVNKHLSHVAALKQVRHDESLDMRGGNKKTLIMNHFRCHRLSRVRPRARDLTGAFTSPALTRWPTP